MGGINGSMGTDGPRWGATARAAPFLGPTVAWALVGTTIAYHGGPVAAWVPCGRARPERHRSAPCLLVLPPPPPSFRHARGGFWPSAGRLLPAELATSSEFSPTRMLLRRALDATGVEHGVYALESEVGTRSKAEEEDGCGQSRPDSLRFDNAALQELPVDRSGRNQPRQVRRRNFLPERRRWATSDALARWKEPASPPSTRRRCRSPTWWP